MATKKDLVEAHAFSRRRLVTAFLSGAPGGREVEPARPGRTIVGGLALSVLLIAAAAIASVLASKTEEDWNKVGLVVSREEAAPYVILEDEDDPELIPILNITSAQLILGADVEPTYVEQDVIEQQTPGETIGIFGAPQTLPRPDRFIEDGWTACTGDGRGIMLGLRTDPDVDAVDRGGLVVTNQGRDYLVARAGDLADVQRAMIYPLPAPGDGTDSVDAMLNELGLRERAEAVAVPEDWLQLFPTGGELAWETFQVDGAGKPPLDPAPYPPGAKVGDYWIDGEEGLVLTGSGPMRLSAFALQVYRYSPIPAKKPGRPGRLPRLLEGEPPLLSEQTRTYLDASWPDEPLEQLTYDPCALLVTDPGGVPGVELVQNPGDELSAAPLGDPLVIDYSIEDGRGAYVQSGDWDDVSGLRSYVVDPRGTAYSLRDAQTVEKLRYDEVPAPLVPDSWVELFGQGVDLSTADALCPPSPDPVGDRECRELPS
ncbi:type VII secretion protein EccB [Nocardioides sp.]|uniref:type VII secretion protein EccB n=1 Tax=Nocardioides sp. TaxID=35761 RepID=UPI001A2FCF86|nr:type VII secretion protein EccB [Nocardioides sp.]MBJ7359587.1 type VII secretion protein EccB [Nocardioides sp.]